MVEGVAAVTSVAADFSAASDWPTRRALLARPVPLWSVLLLSQHHQRRLLLLLVYPIASPSSSLLLLLVYIELLF